MLFITYFCPEEYLWKLFIEFGWIPFLLKYPAFSHAILTVSANA